MDAHDGWIEHLQSPSPKGVKRFFQFSLRSLFWAITFWSVLVCVGTRLGLVEALEVVLGLIAVLILATWFHREFRVERHRITALLAVLHVRATLLAGTLPNQPLPAHVGQQAAYDTLKAARPTLHHSQEAAP